MAVVQIPPLPSDRDDELFVMNADGTGVTQISDSAGMNLIAHWGELRVKSMAKVSGSTH